MRTEILKKAIGDKLLNEGVTTANHTRERVEQILNRTVAPHICLKVYRENTEYILNRIAQFEKSNS